MLMINLRKAEKSSKLFAKHMDNRANVNHYFIFPSLPIFQLAKDREIVGNLNIEYPFIDEIFMDP